MSPLCCCIKGWLSDTSSEVIQGSTPPLELYKHVITDGECGYDGGVTQPKLIDFLGSRTRVDVCVDSHDHHQDFCDMLEVPVVRESGQGAKPGTCLGVWAETPVLVAGQMGYNPC